ncbi:MAG: division/cell wall cluster transcriptional repressor MraZ [Prevotella sp.]
MRFIGNIEARIDAKGRVFLPAVFRKVLRTSDEEGLILRKDVFQSCLVLYPESVWNAQMDALRARLSRWNALHQQIFRQFVSDAETLPIDANGRILLPKRYLAMCGIEREVKFIGMGDTIEIWNMDIARTPFMDGADFGKALENIMYDVENNTDETR